MVGRAWGLNGKQCSCGPCLRELTAWGGYGHDSQSHTKIIRIMIYCDIQGARYKTGLCYGREGARRLEEHWSHDKGFDLCAGSVKTSVLKRRETWSEMQLKNIIFDGKGRKEWRRTGMQVEVPAADCSHPSKRWKHFCIGDGSTQKHRNHPYYTYLFSRSGKMERTQILQSQRLRFHSWLH